MLKAGALPASCMRLLGSVVLPASATAFRDPKGRSYSALLCRTPGSLHRTPLSPSHARDLAPGLSSFIWPKALSPWRRHRARRSHATQRRRACIFGTLNPLAPSSTRHVGRPRQPRHELPGQGEVRSLRLAHSEVPKPRRRPGGPHWQLACGLHRELWVRPDVFRRPESRAPQRSQAFSYIVYNHL